MTENFERLSVTVYLESMGKKFSYLKGYDQVRSEMEPEQKFDLCITLDASDVQRLGAFAPYLMQAGDSLCIDHHITNTGLARQNVIESAPVLPARFSTASWIRKRSAAPRRNAYIRESFMIRAFSNIPIRRGRRWRSLEA